ncbi:hypothetical protein PR048_016034 [Dryococelus australis]|uniref:Uncharacterized protein n=1 Tax=Dryococelus australis TaxID=614101 RepID=A0ABQ9HIM2_9NEOP|nr:hypothetical protein PR048_016034 [Dryococelus australis]
MRVQQGCKLSQGKIRQCEQGMDEIWRVMNDHLEMCSLGNPQKWKVFVTTCLQDLVFAYAYCGNIAGNANTDQMIRNIMELFFFARANNAKTQFGAKM